MDNVSGLVDESKKIAIFLTVARKFNYTCVYIFHTIYPEKSGEGFFQKEIFFWQVFH